MSQIAPPQARQNVDLSSALDIVCESCGSKQFKEIAFIKRVSAIISPNGREMVVPVATFACAACSHVNKEFDPFASKE
jgi:DNA-directed RNA polymerase subunit RPC12/RpoP